MRLIRHTLRYGLRQNYGKIISSYQRKSAATSSIVLLFARVFRLLDREDNPVVDIRELQDAADGIEAEALFEIIHQRVHPLAALPAVEVVDPRLRLRDQKVIGQLRQPSLIPRPLLPTVEGFRGGG